MNQSKPASLEIAGKTLTWGSRTYLMGILNLTPDSFSGDGLAGDQTATVEQIKLFEPEADILDLGAESTRPNATPVAAEQELARLLPVIEATKKISQHLISVDTFKPEVARTTLQAGANIVNDITGLTDPAMRELVAERGVP